MPTPSILQSKLRVTLNLPESLYDEYAERASKLGRKPEEELVKRLTDCAAHTSSMGIYLTDHDRGILSQSVGINLATADELVRTIVRQSTISVGGISIALEARLRQRLDSRRFGSTLADVIRRETIAGLESFCGMR